MLSDLDQLIKALEAEKKYLERAIKNCIQEFDYLIAYYHSEALSQINNRLSVLYTFKDPLHLERENLKRMEALPQKRPERITDKQLWERMQERWKEKAKIKKYEFEEKAKGVKLFFFDSQEIDDALINLFEGKCSGFKIILSPHNKVELLFVIENETLLISIGDGTVYEQDFIVDNRIPDPFAGLGFKFNPANNQHEYSYAIKSVKQIEPIKILLSRLMYDVFQFYYSAQTAKLIYL